MDPSKVTALSMDCPTESQVDVQVQQRSARDPVKSLEKPKKWQSKITGIMLAGIDMMANCKIFVRDRLAQSQSAQAQTGNGEYTT